MDVTRRATRLRLTKSLRSGNLFHMRRVGWCLLFLASVVASACEGTTALSGGSAGSSGRAGNGGNAGSSGGGGQPVLSIGGSPSNGIGAQSDGGRTAVDLSTVLAPLVRCHGMAGTGGQAGNGNLANGGDATGEVTEGGGAPWDDDCAPPPSQCVDGLTLVYFDQGECVGQRCTWQKLSLMCQNQCQRTGCQDSITTK